MTRMLPSVLQCSRALHAHHTASSTASWDWETVTHYTVSMYVCLWGERGLALVTFKDNELFASCPSLLLP
jgi:hypothetical protein